MATVLYTTTEAIRAAIGVTDKEVEDVQITDLNTADQIEFSLETVYPDHAALAVAQGGSPTPEQIRLFKLLKLYCQYEGAVICLMAGQHLLAQKITDGDAEMQRFNKDNMQDTLNQIKSLRDRYRGMLSVGVVTPTVTMATLPLLTAVSPGYDPVTNEGSEI